jgi:uncharacterized phage infection (PIP) family protein YhgE
MPHAHRRRAAGTLPASSNQDQPADPKVGLTGDQVENQGTCSGSDHTDAQACADLATLRQSVKDLKDVDVVQNGTSALESQLDEVKADARNLRDSVRASVRPAVDALGTALSDLASAVSNVVSGGIAPVQSAARDVADRAHDVEAQLAGLRCQR